MRHLLLIALLAVSGWGATGYIVFSTDKYSGSTICVEYEYKNDRIFKQVYSIEERDKFLIIRFKNGSKYTLIKENISGFGEINGGEL